MPAIGPTYPKRATIPSTPGFWPAPTGPQTSFTVFIIAAEQPKSPLTIAWSAAAWSIWARTTSEAGTSGYVDISNRSDDAGMYVIADAIRFGNGMGDIDRGGGVSGHAREDEAALYWIMAQAGQGTPASAYRDFSSDRSSTIRAPILWAAHMNRENEGTAEDRVYLGFHSNASSGTARGAVALYNSGSGSNTPTPHQYAWAEMLGSELAEDMVAIGSPPLEFAWVDRSSDVYGASFGEIDNRCDRR